MSEKQKITGNKKAASKNAVISEIILKISQALPALKESLGVKKFDKRIKKVAKLLVVKIKSTGSKKISAAKIPAKKIAKSPGIKNNKSAIKISSSKDAKSAKIPVNVNAKALTVKPVSKIKMVPPVEKKMNTDPAK